MDDYYYSRTSHPFTFFNSQWPELYSPSFAATANKSDVSLRPLSQLAARAPTTDVVNRLLYIDTMTWLPDDLLIKADKITMANSVELRVPLLDHRLLEFCASLPGSYKVKRFTTKYIAKRVLRNCVPKEISNRKKAGFPVPYASWLRTTMKDWVRETLLDSRAYTQSYFSKTAVERLLAENISTQSYAKEVFSLLVLELWHREFLGRARA
jgi:asparagine synthase (glutamine-hydrolysing)